MYIVIIDMDQPTNRLFLGMTGEDGWDMAVFDTMGQIKRLKEEHTMGVFTWLVINIDPAPGSVINPPYSLEVLT